MIPLLDLDHSTLGQFYPEPRRAARFSRTAGARRVPRDGFGGGVARRRDFDQRRFGSTHDPLSSERTLRDLGHDHDDIDVSRHH